MQAAGAGGLDSGDREMEKRDRFGVGRVDIADGLAEEVRGRGVDESS